MRAADGSNERFSTQADDSTVNVIKHAIWNTMSIFIGQERNLQNYLQTLMNGAILIILVMVTT